MNKVIVLVLAVLVASAVLLGCQSAPSSPTAAPAAAPSAAPASAPAATTAVRGVTKDTIKIAFVGNFVGLRTDSTFPDRDGALLRIKEINAAGGINGRKLETVIVESGTSTKEILAALQRAVEVDKAFAVWGANTTDQVRAIMPEVITYKIPFVETTASTPAITAVFNRYLFRPSPNHVHMAYTAVDAAMDLFKPKRPAAFHLDNGFGQESAWGVETAFKKYGIQLVEKAALAPNNTDASGAIVKLKAANPDVVFATSYGPQLNRFYEQSAQLGLNVKHLAISGTGPRQIKGAGKAAIGVMGQYWPIEVVEGDAPVMVDFRKRFYAAYPDADQKFRPQDYDFIGYSSIDVIAEGLKRAGADLTEAKFIAALEGLKAFDTLTGPVTFTPTNHEGWDTYKFFEILTEDVNIKLLPKRYGGQEMLAEEAKAFSQQYASSFSKEYLDLLKTQ